MFYTVDAKMPRFEAHFLNQWLGLSNLVTLHMLNILVHKNSFCWSRRFCFHYRFHCVHIMNPPQNCVEKFSIAIHDGTIEQWRKSLALVLCYKLITDVIFLMRKAPF